MVMLWPFQVTAPLSRSMSPNTARMAVVLPAPLGPRNPVIRPGRAVKVQASRARTLPNVLVAEWNSSITVTPWVAAAHGVVAERDGW